MSRYEDKIGYKADIESVFQFLSKTYGGGSKTLDYVENHSDYTISFSYGPGSATHGERATIKLSTQGENVTGVHIVSESIQKEFDCGNNKTHIMLIMSKLGKEFEPIAISEKTKRDSKVTKIGAVIAIAVLLFLCVSCVRWIANSDGGGVSNDECVACHGSGMVNDGFLDFKTCPVCKGTGLPPH